jgi:hypothetical protein
MDVFLDGKMSYQGGLRLRPMVDVRVICMNQLER